MEEFSITWSENICDKNSSEKLEGSESKITFYDQTKLVKSSSIWNSDENTKVESVDTYLGVFNEELWL